jgi:hypothetical protein
LEVNLDFVLAKWFFEDIFKDFPIEADVEMFYLIVAPHNPQVRSYGLDKLFAKF